MSGAQSSQAIQYQGDSVRLDVFLTDFFEHSYTRSYWTNMIEHGYVQVNTKNQKAGFKLKNGSSITISWPAVTDEYSNKVKILYEDDDVLAIDKPAGMLVHSKGAFNPEYTLASYIAQKTGRKQSIDEREGIVHRLDRQTSGVMMLAKNKKVAQMLMEQFAARHTDKFYVAVVEGRLDVEPSMIDVPLARSSKNPKTFEPNPNGKSAQTHIQVLRAEDEYSVVLLKPITGRTHQLRAHLKYLKHPIIGDLEYGAKIDPALHEKRFLLHAYSLKISIPKTSEPKQFVAPLPQDMTLYIHEDDQTAIDGAINAFSA